MAEESGDFEYILALRETADNLLAESKLKEAQEALLEIKKLSPDDDKLLIEIGDLCLRLDNAFGAKYYYEQARRIDGSNVNIYSKLALIYHYQLKQPLKAEQYYQSIFILDPTNSFAYFNLAKLYIQQNRHDDAQIAFKKCLETDSHNALYHNEYGKLLQQMGELKDAEWELKQAMLMDDTNQTYQHDHAKILMKLNSSAEGSIAAEGFGGDDVVADIIAKRWTNSDQKTNNYSLQNNIQSKARLLLSGFCHYVGITMDMKALCFFYFTSDYPRIIYDNKLSCLSDFGREEVERLLFTLLCPGREQNVYAMLVELCEILTSAMHSESAEYLIYKFVANYMSYLLSSATIIDLYGVLKQLDYDGEENYTENVVDVATKMVHFRGKWKGLSFAVLIWSVLCRESDVFYLKYRMNVTQNVIDKNEMIEQLEESKLCDLSVQDMRNIGMALLFDEEMFDLVSGSTLGIVCALAAMVKDGVKDVYKICIYWIGLEMKLVNKKQISDNVNLLLNSVMIPIWKQLNEDIGTVKFHYDILKIFMRKGISLKPMTVEWGEFYAIIVEIVLKDDTLKEIVLEHCEEQLRENMFPKKSWKQCIELLK